MEGELHSIEEVVEDISSIIEWVKKGAVHLRESEGQRNHPGSNVFRISVGRDYYEVVVSLSAFAPEKAVFVAMVAQFGALEIVARLDVSERPYFYALGAYCGLWSYDSDLNFQPGMGNLKEMYPKVFSQKSPWEFREMDSFWVRRFLERPDLGLGYEDRQKIFLILFSTEVF